MKKGVLILIALLSLACKEKERAPEIPKQELTLLDSIAHVYGYKNWNTVNKISFTFNVNRPDRQYARSWIWDTRKNEVTSIIEGDTITYLRKEVDSTLVPIDARFINDKYWLLVPFNLVWDRDSFTYSVAEQVPAPTSGEMGRKLTIVYGDEGGYTPGDAYDFYIGEDMIITEWAWRRSNESEPRLRTSWAAPAPFNGLNLTTAHKAPENTFQLYFSGISVE